MIFQAVYLQGRFLKWLRIFIIRLYEQRLNELVG